MLSYYITFPKGWVTDDVYIIFRNLSSIYGYEDIISCDVKNYEGITPGIYRVYTYYSFVLPSYSGFQPAGWAHPNEGMESSLAI